MFNWITRSWTRWTSAAKRHQFPSKISKVVEQETKISTQDMRILLTELERNWIRYQPYKVTSWDSISCCSFDSESSRATEISWIEEEDECLLDALEFCVRSRDYDSYYEYIPSESEAWV